MDKTGDNGMANYFSSSSTTTSTTTSTTSSVQASLATEEKKVQRWLCDVCKVRWFHDFDEACAHEAQCQWTKKTSSLSSASVQSVVLVTQDTMENDANNTESSSKESLKDSTSDSPIITPTKAPQQQQQQQQAAFVPLVTAIKDRLSEFIPIRNALSEENILCLKDMLQKLESLTMTLEVLQATGIAKLVLKFRKEPSLGPLARSLIEEWKIVAGETTKPRSRKASATAAAKPGSFFVPRAVKKPKTATTTTITTKKKKNNNNINPFFEPRKKQAPSPAEQVLQESKTLKRSLEPTNSKALASIFQNKSSKQIVAEQRMAELAARRDHERKQEQKRQAKRAQLFGKTQVGTSMGEPVQSLLPKAVLFPVPNHVPMMMSSRSSPSNLRSLLPKDHCFLVSSQEPTASRENTKPTKWLSSPDALDTTDVSTTQFTRLQRVLFDTFSVGPFASESSSSSFLWKDVYGMNPNCIVGQKSQEIFRQLVQWIDHWRVARQKAQERMAERHRKLAKKKTVRKKKKRARNEYDWDDDDSLWGDLDDDDDMAAPLCLLTGPPASGKTSMVHTVAKHCGNCTVLEIHTGQVRSGAALKHAIEEATQSNSSLEMLKTKTTNTSSNRLQQQQQDKSSLSIVLIDEVDILFEEDAGFWNALGSLAKATKCPIFLTANKCPPEIHNLWCKSFRLERPTPMECASKILQVCSHPDNPLKMRKDAIAKGPEAVQKQLSVVATACACDMRKLLNELQVFAAAAATTKSSWKASLTRKTVMTTTTGSSSLVCPKLHSLDPIAIPANQHSILTIRGTNLSVWKNESLSIRIGSSSKEPCPFRIVDDTTLKVLCPPYQKETGEKMTQFVSVAVGKRTICSRRVASEELSDGTQLLGSNYLVVEYEEDSHLLSETDRGLLAWKSSLPCSESLVQRKTTQEDLDMASRLDRLADAALLSSDASLLEDYVDGLPYLSGACKGFGFECTETKHETSKPPRAEKLFELGWNDTACFHGSPDAYVTLPSRSERSDAKRVLNHFRGLARQQLTTVTPEISFEETSSREDLDRWSHRTTTSEEDLYLPRGVSPSVLDLPIILFRASSQSHPLFLEESLLEADRSKTLSKLVSYGIDYILPQVPSDLLRCTYGRFGLKHNENDQCAWILECLPILRRIGCLEKAFESSEQQQQQIDDDSKSATIFRRQTRSQAKARRHHYFDRISIMLKRDETLLNSSEFGSLLARESLLYSK